MKISKFTEQSLLFSIIKSAEQIKRELSKELKPENLNFYQALILICLYTEKHNNLVPSDLCNAFNLPKAVVSQSLTRLEELKFIKRIVNEDDARKTWIHLSTIGEKKATSLMNTLHKLDKKIERNYSKEEVKQFLFLLKNW